MKELINLGLVHEVGAYKSTGGRKAKAYASIPDAKLAIGVDITKNHIGFTLVDLSGMVIRYTRKTRAFSSDENYFKNLGDLMNSFLKDDEFDRIIGVGISIPGIISDDGKRIIFLMHLTFMISAQKDLLNLSHTLAYLSMMQMLPVLRNCGISQILIILFICH